MVRCAAPLVCNSRPPESPLRDPTTRVEQPCAVSCVDSAIGMHKSAWSLSQPHAPRARERPPGLLAGSRRLTRAVPCDERVEQLPATIPKKKIDAKEGVLEKQGGGVSLFGSKAWRRRCVHIGSHGTRPSPRHSRLPVCPTRAAAMYLSRRAAGASLTPMTWAQLARSRRSTIP